jgi:hypothetical protein
MGKTSLLALMRDLANLERALHECEAGKFDHLTQAESEHLEASLRRRIVSLSAQINEERHA